MEIGKIYRYSIEPEKMGPCIPEVDDLPNYFFHTNDPHSVTKVMLNHGIQHIKPVCGPDSIRRCPAIIISSSPHRYGTEMTPWEDSYDPDYGYICYYGDNKSTQIRPEDAPGNRLMLNAFRIHSSPSQEERASIGTPIIFFKRVAYGNRKKGNLMFQGFGVIENAELVTQYDVQGSYFSNYMFDLCVFSIASENEFFDWSWINDRRNPSLSSKDTLVHAPKAWKTWITHGNASLEQVRRKVSLLSIVKAYDQQPPACSRAEHILLQIYEYYKTDRHCFEMLAMRVTEYILHNSGIKTTPGWVTSKSADGGVDYILRMDIDHGLSGAKIIILGQAKCERPDKPTNGQHIARTVARLKRGWIGAYVTTSYYSSSVQQEVLDDHYPIMLINGKKVAETVDSILYERGITLPEFLTELDSQYVLSIRSRRAEDILRF